MSVIAYIKNNLKSREKRKEKTMGRNRIESISLTVDFFDCEIT